MGFRVTQAGEERFFAPLDGGQVTIVFARTVSLVETGENETQILLGYPAGAGNHAEVTIES